MSPDIEAIVAALNDSDAVREAEYFAVREAEYFAHPGEPHIGVIMASGAWILLAVEEVDR